MKRSFLVAVAWCLVASQCLAAWTERYVNAAAAGGGNGTTTATSGASGAWTIAEASALAHAAGIRINIKNGTYTLTTTTLTIAANSATAASAVWWRGYNTTIGDIDTDNSLTKPLVIFTTGYCLISADFNWFSNIRFEGASITVSTGVVRVNAPDNRFWRCRFAGTAADVDCKPYEVTATGDRSLVHSSYITANALAACIRIVDDAQVVGCVCEGGLSGVVIAGNPVLIADCLIKNSASHGINEQTSPNSTMVMGCTIYNSGGDSIRADASTGSLTICNNIFDTSGAYHINAAASAFGGAQIFNNAYRAATTANLNNVYESGQVGNVTETSSPFTNAAGGNFTLISTALSKAAGFPGAIENQSLTGYRDLGVLQRQEAGGAVDPLRGSIP